VSTKVEHESELQSLKEKLEGQIESLQAELQSGKSLSTSGDKVQIDGSVVSEAAQHELEAANKLLEETKKMHDEQVEQLTCDLQTVRDELTALKAAPVSVPEAMPNNSAELQRELDELHEKLTHANTRHDEFVKATKEERERFDNEVKKLSMMVTEERKRVEIKYVFD
jgi:regulator of replication initiation timing